VPKKGNLHHTRKNLKNGQNFSPFTRVNNITHLRHFRWLPDGAGIIPIKNLKQFFFKGQGTPWEVKGHKGTPGGRRARHPSKNA
jgi:hypothetical protein